MGMTMTQKILAAHANRESVAEGELIHARLDLVLGSDVTTPIALMEMKRHGLDRIFDSDRVALVMDHFTPNKDIQAAQNCAMVREFANRHGIAHFYDVGCMGIEHALIPERGLAAPGELIIGADSHTCTYGALGAFSTGVGSTDMAYGMVTGTNWFKVPSAIEVVLTGNPAPHIGGKDTGAVDAREGLLRKTDGGVLFLDEIGELGLDEQAMLLRAVEEKRFLPLGSDSEAFSNFQLIAGTNRDLSAEVAEGRFREDLLARIDLWTFRLPGLSERREDIGPNLDYELERAGERLGRRVTMNKEAREAFLAFAKSEEAVWRANFRDLAGAVMRMATLAEGGRISLSDAKIEAARLKSQWSAVGVGAAAKRKGDSVLARIPALSTEALDPFDLAQLEKVVEVCLEAGSLSEAGRRLFCHSRQKRKMPNDADRLRKYLARFGLSWQGIIGQNTVP